MNNMNGWLPLVVIAAAVASACSDGSQIRDSEADAMGAPSVGDRPAPPPAIMPPERVPADVTLGHPKSGARLALALPANVRATWTAAQLSLATSGAAPRTVRVSVGGDTPVEGTSLTLRVVALVPAFRSDADSVTSASNRPDNPAVLLRLLAKDKTLAEGWVFQKYPEFNTFNSERVHVRLAALTAK